MRQYNRRAASPIAVLEDLLVSAHNVILLHLLPPHPAAHTHAAPLRTTCQSDHTRQSASHLHTTRRLARPRCPSKYSTHPALSSAVSYPRLHPLSCACSTIAARRDRLHTSVARGVSAGVPARLTVYSVLPTSAHTLCTCGFLADHTSCHARSEAVLAVRLHPG